MKRTTSLFPACFSTLIAVLCALLLAFAPTASWAEGETALTSTGGELESGSYILNEDVTLTTDLTVPSGAEVTLDLNGHTLTGTGSGSVVTVSGTLTVKDGSAGEAASGSGSEELAGTTVDNDDGTWTTYYSVTDYDESGELAVTYYSYTSGVITGGASEAGGGVHVAAGGSLTLESGTITGNSAVYAGTDTEGTEAPDYEGGGVYGEAGASITMTGGAISGNTADEGAGVDVQGSSSSSAESDAAFSMSGGVISGNTAADDGGGVRVDLCSFNMTGGTIANNTAEGNYGGGVAVIAQGSMTLAGGTVSNNTAYGANSSGHYGGGIDLDRSSLTMESGLITGNTSSSAGGGVRLYRSSTFTMEGGTIAGNTAADYGGGVALNNSGSDTMSTFTMTDGLIANNEVTDTDIGCGGGVYVETGTFDMSGGTIRDNAACSTFYDTYLYYGGGGVWMYNSTFTMGDGALITGNYAPCGGGAFLYMCTATLSDGARITGNEALYGGGVYAYYNYNSTYAVSGGSITDNEATYGGGIYAYYSNVISGCTVTGNTATYGGGVYATYGAALDGCTITGNTAAQGGGIYDANVSGYTLDMTGCTVTGNTAAASSDSSSSSTIAYVGGGLYVAGGTLATTDGSSSSGSSVVANNLADTSADDLYLSSSASVDLSGVDNLSTEYLADEKGAAIDGWYEDPATARYYKDDAYNIDAVESISSGTEYFLVAAHDLYTVTYYDGYSTGDDGEVLNDGLGDILAQITDNIYGAAVPTTDDPTREGYEFLGWELVEGTASTESTSVLSVLWSLFSASGSSYYSADDIGGMTITGDMAFEAQWEECTYTVTYTDGVEDEEVFADQVTSGITYGKTTPAFEGAGDSSMPTRAGYTFTGWSPEVAETVTEDVTYTAQWTPIIYTVTYHANADDATGSVDSQTASYGGSVTVSANGFTRAGYEFTGWNTASDGSGTAYVPGDSLVVTSDVDLYAQWKMHTYTVTYTDGVEGEEVFADQVTTGLSSGDSTPSFKGDDGATTPTREGYEFTGWSPEVAETVTEDAVYVAQWKEITYTVTYTDGVDDEEVFADQVTSGIPEGDATPAFEAADGTSTPTRAGYTFAGWSPEVAETVTEDVTYTAQWKPVTYTVTYHANADDATGSVDSQTASYGAFVTVFANGFTRTGYTFTGWNTASDGTGTAYAPDDDLAVTSDIDLYAQWETSTYTVTYHANADDATGTTAAQTASYNETVTVSESGFARASYVFTGWNTSPHGDGTAYAPDDKLVVTSNVDLYAQWQEITYTVTYTDGVEGEDVFADQVTSGIPEGDATPAFEGSLEREGYTFTGWSPEVAEKVTADAVYTAQWTPATEDEEEPEESESEDDGSTTDGDASEDDDGGTTDEDEPESEEPVESEAEEESASREVESETAESAETVESDDGSLSGTGDEKFFTAASIAFMGAIALVSGLSVRKRSGTDGR